MEERENKEIWIFLSHSNHDYEKVRKVRNMLEEQDLRPIMFFLKCLNDDDEIDDLIKREIDCRTRFILCDSENARQSKWVQKEINYIQEQQKPIERIDLSKSDTDILAQLTEVRRKSKLFISYAQEDRDLTVQIKQRLSKYDYDVFVDFDNLMPGSSFADTIKNAIDGAVYNGYIIAILTKEGIKSQWVSKEIEYARNFDAMRNINTQSVIPIVIGNEIPEICSGLNCIKISPYTDDLANQITDSLLNKLLMPGQILTYYNIFKKGTHRIPDNEESERLGAIYFKWAKEMDTQNYPPAVMALGYCYEHGIGTEIDLLRAYEQYSDYVGNDGMGKPHAKRLRKILEPEPTVEETPQKITFIKFIAELFKLVFIEFPRELKNIVTTCFKHE